MLYFLLVEVCLCVIKFSSFLFTEGWNFKPYKKEWANSMAKNALSQQANKVQFILLSELFGFLSEEDGLSVFGVVEEVIKFELEKAIHSVEWASHSTHLELYSKIYILNSQQTQLNLPIEQITRI